MATPSTILNRQTLCPICKMSNRSDARFCQQCGNNIWLSNKYRIIRAIKEGGMGAVYEAVDENGKRYALKSLIDRFTDPAERQDAINRFQEEASILREITHPQVPRVYGSFLHGGRYYLAMDFVEGDDLEDLQRKQPNQRFDEKIVLKWAEQTANVLDYLHERRLIYRDVKPSNIMIERATGDVKVVDFGIAKLFQPNERGTLIGTPGYSPPEQYQGQAVPQSDIYALGATLHHLLTGRDPRDEAPFSFPPIRQLAPDVSEATERAISKALAMEIDKRWQSAAEFRAALPLEKIKGRTTRKPQPTVGLDPASMSASASVGAPAQPQRAAKSAKPDPKPKQVAPQPAPQPATRKPFRWWIPLLVFGIVAGLIALGQPSVTNQLNGLIGSSTSTPAAPTNRPTVSQSFQTEVTISVPSGSDDNAIYDAFEQGFLTEAKKQFGDQARLNPSVPPSYQGSVEKLSDDGTTQTLKATMTGRVVAPQQ
ncbi:MAG: protein kinase [Herpetosiphon sp.]|nr:protein kinase [Herpetosiphon sp.]